MSYEDRIEKKKEFIKKQEFERKNFADKFSVALEWKSIGYSILSVFVLFT